MWVHTPFTADPLSKKKKFCIVLPPPNVTGSLHLGHALNATVIDSLIRYKRMRGFETLLQPGTDHAGIITQVQVERALAEEGLTKHDLGREKFLQRVWEWKEDRGGVILAQLGRIGISADWSRTRFTMDDTLSTAVRRQFLRLYHDGLAFRGKRIVNWDPVSKTVLSNLEIDRADRELKLYYIKYPDQNGGCIEIATVRPETIFADTAVAIHPDDSRHTSMLGTSVRIPLTDRWIPVIADSAVDPSFGTGALKITPSCDETDFEIGLRHGLSSPVIIDLSCRLTSELVPAKYRGMDRFEAREAVAMDLLACGALTRAAPYTVSLGISERSDAIIEPVLLDQWFIDSRRMAENVLRGTNAGELRFFPERYRKIHDDWLEKLKPWCISRQLWWGHGIPAWYDEGGDTYVPTPERPDVDPPADPEHREKELTQDTDVFDTWFSSNLWPFSTLGWPDVDNPHYQSFYPTDVLVTGYDILYLWVSRMAMAGYHLTGKAPFRDVVLHGLVLDEKGQKMSKSRGNGIDPLSVIAESGADALRFAMAHSSTGGQDIRWDSRRVEMGRNFNNKLWNAAKYVLTRDCADDAGGELVLSDRWILSRLQRAIRDVSEAYETYDLGAASRSLYSFVWSEFCDWYLESAKLYKDNKETHGICRRVFIVILKLLHPIIPFITSELFEVIAQNGQIALSSWPKPICELIDIDAETHFETVQNAAGLIRALKSQADIPFASMVDVAVTGANAGLDTESIGLLEHLGHCRICDEIDGFALSGATDRFGVAIRLDNVIDLEPWMQRQRKRLENLESFEQRLEARLADQRFREKAEPQVIAENERRLKETREERKRISLLVSGASS